MITDFRIDLERPPFFCFVDKCGEVLIAVKPWVWRCEFTLNGIKRLAAFLQERDARNPKEAAIEIENAITRIMK